MRLSKRFLTISIAVLLVFGIIIVALTVKMCNDAKAFNATERNSETSEYSCYVNIHQRGGSTDSWEKNTLLDNAGNPCTGKIYDADFINSSGFDVADWTMKLNIHEDIYLNNGWCGLFEIHQFDKNGDEKTQTIDLRDYNKNGLEIDYVMDGQDLLIPLKDGDYLVYYPNGEVNEMPIAGAKNGTTSITFGLILYYGETEPDFADTAISYHLYRPLLDEAQKTTVGIMIALWAILAIAFITLLIYSYIMGCRFEEKEITIRESLSVFSGFVDAKDPYTNGHSERVGRYAMLISEKLGMSKEECRNNYYIGLMHDCGKCYLPDEILKKPTHLTSEEFEIVKTHTTHGAELLEGFNEIKGIKDGARYHHERYDGEGYPEGLAGEAIPLIARILCVADAFDAMNSKRYYRDRLGIDNIVKELKRCSGTQFDPKLVTIFLELIDEQKIGDFEVLKE